MQYRFVGATLLIAGTSIGAGMLALPVATAPIGFYLSIILLTGVWLFMCFTGLLVIEANLWLPKNTSFISMSKQTLGRLGEILTWFIFVLLLYSLLAAYITGGGALVVAVEELFLRNPVQPWMSYLPWIIVFSVIIYFGLSISDILNRLLMIGLIVTFAALATAVTPHVNVHLFNGTHTKYLLAALPVLFASFGYHIVLPSVRDYLHGQTHLLKWAVVIGSFIPLFFYIIWEALVFGVIPVSGPNGLLTILNSGQPTLLLTQSLSEITHNYWIATTARFFVFFAIASSFVGVSLGLFDLLADGFKIKKTKSGRLVLAFLTFIPPLIYALSYPKGFIIALSYAGVFVAILHGILPMAMVWAGRYRLHLANGFKVFGGRFILLIVFLLSCLVIYSQIARNLHWIAVMH